ncbi:MAG TPA: undecaprenyl/decaprenyl-phosphate alpha-N-acetylglucosaminyl 1-phosphate transferase [bacterium]|nr:undecaprenyl/decaprenyl-phosphate alpha-N-acetylglucosaminyl 1-phosphate transferase [bacterium]
MIYLAIGISSFILSLVLTPLAMKAAVRFGIMDRPVTGLKKHKKPVPYLGGVSIFIAFAVPVIVSKLIIHQELYGVVGILAGAALMMMLGLFDDIKGLSPAVKLVFQFMAALIVLKVNLHIKFMDNNIFNYALTILWVVGVTNSINLIDIMDGLAGGVVAVASLAFFVAGMLAGRINDMIPAIALFGAVMAFLVYNRHPARIYMGDAGALFLGFMMAVLALNQSYSRVNYIAVLSPLLILGVPLFDTFLVIFARLRKGLLPIYGSDDHLAQRLVMIGLSKTNAVRFLVGLTFVLSALAITSTFLAISGALVLYLGIAIAAIMFAMLVMSVDMKNYRKVHRKRK